MMSEIIIKYNPKDFVVSNKKTTVKKNKPKKQANN